MVFPIHGGTWLSTTEFALFVTFLAICTLFITLRIWSRTLQKGLRPRALSISDYVVFIGYLATVGNTTCMIVTVIAGGSGQHASTLSDATKMHNQKALFAAAFFWITATCTLKMSILLLYTEIFQAQIPRRIACGILSLVASFFIGFLVAIFTQCFPFSMNWDKNAKGHCGNLTAESRAGAFINLIFDTMITIFPMPLIWSLQMPAAKRIGLILLFGLGTAADGVGVARAVISMNPSAGDYNYFSAKTNILAAMELWLGVIIACIPLIKPALAKLHIIKPTSGTHAFSAGQKGSGSRPVYRSDPEALSTPSSGLSAQKSSAASRVSKSPDAWERQYQYMESDEDILPLRELSPAGNRLSPRIYLRPV